jgi:hypothetical protein
MRERSVSYYVSDFIIKDPVELEDAEEEMEE